MNTAQCYELEQIALALAAYANAAKNNPELMRLLNGIPVPGGYDIDHFAKQAVRLSNAFPWKAKH